MASAVSPPSKQTLRRHFWLAAPLSLLTLGLGQVYVGRARWAACFLGAWLVFLGLLLTPVPSTFPGFVVSYFGLWGVHLLSAAHAGFTAWREPLIEPQSYHRWYFYVGYVVGCAAIMVGAIFVAIDVGGYRVFRASSRAMVPALNEGELFFVQTARGATKSELETWLGSIVVVSWPYEQGAFVYRLIAVGGQSVDDFNGAIHVNGKPLDQKALCTVLDAASGTTARRSIETVAGRRYVVQNFDDYIRDTDAVAIPEDQFYVLGDTRENSYDSRFRGPVVNSDYAGRALFIIWSNDWGRIGTSLTPGPSVDRAAYCPPAAK